MTNVSYNRITTVDYKNQNFAIDCFTFLILYLNPFYLERKFESGTEREFVNVLWMFLMPSNLYNFISQYENMTKLNKIKIKYLDVKKIILEFLQYDQDNLKVLSNYLEKNGILYQFFYGNLNVFLELMITVLEQRHYLNTYYQNFNIQKNVINWQNNNNLTIKEKEVKEVKEAEKQMEIYDNASPINMTTLDQENTIKKETKNRKRKINNTETKYQKRELKKQKLLQQLNENTEKIKKLKKEK